MDRIVPDSVKQAVGAKGDAKQEQMRPMTSEPTQQTRITTDWGTKQHNTDNWLRVNREDQAGPMLLEDGFSREKVWLHLSPYISGATQLTRSARSTDSTMSEFPNELYMLVALVPLATSASTSLLQTSPTLEF
jgi:hypothetical protein